jgi:hypothetical protein
MNKSTTKVVQIVDLFYVLLKTQLLAGVMIPVVMYQMLKKIVCVLMPRKEFALKIALLKSINKIVTQQKD